MIPTIHPSLLPTKPDGTTESPAVQQIINLLNMQNHPEGGYYVETDRDSLRIPNPYTSNPDDGSTRSASTTIYYLLTPQSPVGHFHRNKGRTIHTLHRGRGVYVLIHADEVDLEGRARMEVFTVGQDLGSGEQLQWIVEGGKYKTSFLLPDYAAPGADGSGRESGGLLISETVVPGFEFEDHDFLKKDAFVKLTSAKEAEQLEWLLSKSA